jgi:menaquinone-9 beta-reductase
MDHDAIVIGGGPAGSSIALILARRGRSVAIIEKSEFPRRKVCGEFMSATNLAVLDKMGIGTAWREEAGPEIRRVALFAADTCVEAPMPPTPTGGFGRAWGRDRLDATMLEAARLAGARVMQPGRAISIEKEGEVQAVLVAYKDKSLTLRAPVIIAAHGSWEPGKLPTQSDKLNRPSDLLGFKAHFTGASMPRDLMPLLIFSGGYGGMVWADRDRFSLSCCVRRDRLTAARVDHPGASAAEAVQHLVVVSCRGARNAIGDAILAGAWLAAGPIRPGIRPRYENDIFRVGNVAGESHPIIAEGLSMAIQSGWLLASELARVDVRDRAARAHAGRRYAAAWKDLFAMRIRAAGVLAHLAVRPPGALLMRIFVRLFPQSLAIGARLAGKTKDIRGVI